MSYLLLWEGFALLQKSSRCILLPQPTGQTIHCGIITFRTLAKAFGNSTSRYQNITKLLAHPSLSIINKFTNTQTHTYTQVYIYILSSIIFFVRILEGVLAKNLQATLLFVDFTKAFDSKHRGKMEQILLAYGLPKETVVAITILFRNTKVKVRSPDEDTEYFDIVAGVLQGDTLAPYLFIICLDYVLRTSIDRIRENGFELTKKRSRRYLQKQLPTPMT